ncbi:FGGY family carbohydrate kinase, partial [Nocardioides sp.]|uniref:FGGY family carbohydrate kinase n=1 Tax=Nocardioides sp. TaxID=35761 RepID=UPI0027340A85
MTMQRHLRVAAVDLGATSGRVMVAEVGAGRLHLEEVHRFPNAAVRVNGSLQWDILAIHREVVAGLSKAARSGPIDGIGIDSWAVDYGLLDATESLLGNPVSHRDSRTDGVAEKVAADVGAERLYDVTGLQQLPFTTIYQLVAARGTPQLEAAATLLLLPDLLGYWLTGRVGAEHTNASTTGLYDVRGREWATELADRVGVPSAILPPLREAGDVVG